MKKFLRNYRVEIIITILAVTAGGLLIFSGLRQAVFSTFYGGIALILGRVQSLADGLIAYSATLTLYDLLGWLLIFGAIGYVLISIRSRFQDRPEYEATVCPRCGSNIRRAHRTAWDRLLGKTLLPNSRRYQCVNRECGWKGLRRKRHHLESGFSDREGVKE